MDWSTIVGNVGTDQFHERIRTLNAKGMVTSEIETTVEHAVENLSKGTKSFVIFGEPQSGKTEMMIALNARLFDEKFDVIINLLTDSVDLLNQKPVPLSKRRLKPVSKTILRASRRSKDARGKAMGHLF